MAPKLLRRQSSSTSQGAHSQIKVCVRVRPFNTREQELGQACCVEMPTEDQVVVNTPDGPKSYQMDRCYYSHDPKASNFATQETLMGEVGIELRENALHGFNSCLFAYGQTGSGKTYSVTGCSVPKDLRGLLPRLVDALFDTIEDTSQAKGPDGKPMLEFELHVSYLEVYQEKLRDLLAPSSTEVLTIRTNPSIGTYVEHLKEPPVFKREEVQQWLDFGAKSRSVGATSMNSSSSRSHCIFIIELAKKETKADGTRAVYRSKLNVVDLAGSERQKKTQATGARLAEGSSINKSLSALALVTSKLAEVASDPKKAKEHVPFRDSKLTHLLQDSLSGNSKTTMIAAISPAPDNCEESLSTLRFANNVKSIKMKVSQNADVEGTMVAKLQAEIDKLRAGLASGGGEGAAEEIAAMQSLQEKYGMDIQKRLELAASLEEDRKEMLDDMGLSLTEITQLAAGGLVSASTPQLVNVSADVAISGCLVYYIPKGEPVNLGSCAKQNKIVLQGVGMSEVMAELDNKDDSDLYVTAINGRVIRNGHRMEKGERIQLHTRDRIMFGHAYCFHVHVPSDDSGHFDHMSAEEMHEYLQKNLSEVKLDSELFQMVEGFAADIQTKIDADAARSFVDDVHKWSSLIDESNSITDEVRQHSGLEFRLEHATSVRTYLDHAPESIVRLVRHSSQSPVVGEAACHKCKSPIVQTVALMSTEAFEIRLGLLRDLHLHHTRLEDGETLPHDPWCADMESVEVGGGSNGPEVVPAAPGEMQRLMHEKDAEIARLRLELQRFREPPPPEDLKLADALVNSMPNPEEQFTTRLLMRLKSAQQVMLQNNDQIRQLGRTVGKVNVGAKG